MRDFYEDVVIPCFFIFGGLAVLAGLFTVFIAAWDYTDCKGFNKGTGIETRWWWGCYANVEGQWVPKDYAFGKVNELRLKEKK